MVYGLCIVCMHLNFNMYSIYLHLVPWARFCDDHDNQMVKSIFYNNNSLQCNCGMTMHPMKVEVLWGFHFIFPSVLGTYSYVCKITIITCILIV